MIVGSFPFTGIDVKDLFQNIRNQQIDFDNKELSQVSSNCKNFLSNLLNKDNNKRMSSYEALKHPWLSINSNNDKNIDKIIDKKGKNMRSNLNNYQKSNKLTKAIKMFHFKLNRNAKDINRLRDLFLLSDENNNGSLDKYEFRVCMKHM